MMMLTLPTAKELGVKNRLDPKQSIEGGARYLSKLRDRLKDVPEPDRTWLALAAYNVGYGHLRDARKITEDRKSTRLNSSHVRISYAVFCLKKKRRIADP